MHRPRGFADVPGIDESPEFLFVRALTAQRHGHRQGSVVEPRPSLLHLAVLPAGNERFEILVARCHRIGTSSFLSVVAIGAFVAADVFPKNLRSTSFRVTPSRNARRDIPRLPGRGRRIGCPCRRNRRRPPSADRADRVRSGGSAVGYRRMARGQSGPMSGRGSPTPSRSSQGPGLRLMDSCAKTLTVATATPHVTITGDTPESKCGVHLGSSPCGGQPDL